MTNRNTFKLLFYINTSKIKKDGNCPVMLRITISGKAVAFSIKRDVQKEDWNGQAGLAKGKSTQVVSLNKYIDAVRAKAYEKFTELHSMYEYVSAEMLRDAILGVSLHDSKTILEIWDEHNSRLKSLIGKENSYTVWQKYQSCRNYFSLFLERKYNRKDIGIRFIDREMVVQFEFYLKTEKGCASNTTVKYLQQFKKIIRIAILNGWLKNDPFQAIKLTIKEVDRPYLSEEELRSVLQKSFQITRLATVRDIFVFACFTGLSYSDIKKLNKAEMEQDAAGAWWIRSKRQKTGVRANIPLLEVPLAILGKYCNLDLIAESDKLLPVASNQKVNVYLKEIADVCNISKSLTFHVARHTFATTVTLTHGVPIESVSKMLGHKNIKQTQHYARIVDLKVGEDMKALAQKLNGKLDFRQV